MKKIFCLLGLACIAIGATAQDEFDAVRMTSTDITGSARYVGMSGAFGALGGDVSAIKDNPAALGVYRTSEASITWELNTNLTNSSWNGENAVAVGSRLPLTQATYVLNFTKGNKTKGLVSHSFSFQYDRLKVFNTNIACNGSETAASLTDFMAIFAGNTPEEQFQFTDTYSPYDWQGWLPTLGYQGYLINPTEDGGWKSALNSDEKVTPKYSAQEFGSINNYAINWGGNISNKVYIGVGINLQNVIYSLYSKYSESFAEGGGFTLNSEVSTSGVGCNATAGIIVRPINLLRVGLSVQTPTILKITHGDWDNKADLTSYGMTDDGQNAYADANIGYPWGSSYRLISPLKANASMAFVFGKTGLLSLEYNYTRFHDMTLSDTYGDTGNYGVENGRIRSTLQDQHTIKIGAEVKPSDNWAIRAGAAYQTPITKTNAAKLLENMWTNSIATDVSYWIQKGTAYASCGFGYRGSWWYIDAAYQYRLGMYDFYAFDDSQLASAYKGSAASVHSTNHNLIATFGVKF